MSSGSVQEIVVLGGQLLLEQYYLVSSLALLFYEHLLTLGDEVRYIWSNRVTLAGLLFYVTRYFVPICMSVITAVVTTKWGETVCKTLGPLELAVFTVIGTASSILLLLRVYALYNHNKWTLGYLSSVIVIQLVVSTFVYAFPGHGPLPAPPIDVPAFQGCLYLPSPRLKDGAYIPFILELTYDVSIIGLIVAKSWKDRALNGLRDQGGILRIIVKDGIIYFLVIFSTMFIWLCMVLFAPPGLKLVNSGSSNILISIMINRLTINIHRSAKGNYGTSLTPSAVQLPTWMFNTQDHSSSSD
ncbi:hypothetical protein JB92DRAFT_3140432 [Gautieria morchelliformis]|nr:hypothetical protein JB92DRAFT_3140432 [Gautieria morchelliformis]